MTTHPFYRRAGWIACWALSAGLTALSAQAGDKSLRSGAVAASAPVATQPPLVSRLIVRYRDAIKGPVVGAAAPDAERAEAQAVVSRSAARAGALPMRYLKSISPRVQVVALDQPVSADDAQALMQRLRADPNVLDVMVDQRVRAHAVPNDPSFTNGDQWHLRSPGEVPGGINAVAAWSRSTGAGVVIALLDGGHTEHADLLPNMLPGYDFVSGDPANSVQARAGQPFWTANDGNGRDAFARPASAMPQNPKAPGTAPMSLAWPPPWATTTAADWVWRMAPRSCRCACSAAVVATCPTSWRVPAGQLDCRCPVCRPTPTQPRSSA